MSKKDSEEMRDLVQISPLNSPTAEHSGESPVTVPVHVKSSRHRPKEQTEISPLHDFMSKLRQPEMLDNLKEYVSWQARWREGYSKDALTFEEALESAPRCAPISINLDLTTACNYSCDHCVDFDILNKKIDYNHQHLKDSLTNLVENGLRSVIMIGGGEPTAYRGFDDIVRHLKALGVQIGIVTNGSMMKKVEAVADVLEARDWVRLSLDAGTNETFLAMHKPGSAKCTLEWICGHVPAIKKLNPEFGIGFSFIITWKDCRTNDATIVENLDEIVKAAALAKEHEFDYISLKPFLKRAEINNAEIVGMDKDEVKVTSIMSKIRHAVNAAKALEDENFAVVESTNLRVFQNGSYMEYAKQPNNCHMQYFRQVLSPLGLFNCPVYRHVPQAQIGDKHSYATPESLERTQTNTLRLIESFHAAEECKDVTCLYNHANWFIEDLINSPEKLDNLEPSPACDDFFL